MKNSLESVVHQPQNVYSLCVVENEFSTHTHTHTHSFYLSIILFFLFFEAIVWIKIENLAKAKSMRRMERERGGGGCFHYWDNINKEVDKEIYANSRGLEEELEGEEQEELEEDLN